MKVVRNLFAWLMFVCATVSLLNTAASYHEKKTTTLIEVNDSGKLTDFLVNTLLFRTLVPAVLLWGWYKNKD